jgi:hypothetical protein
MSVQNSGKIGVAFWAHLWVAFTRWDSEQLILFISRDGALSATPRCLGVTKS